jgi:hypothetical protein
MSANCRLHGRPFQTPYLLVLFNRLFLNLKVMPSDPAVLLLSGVSILIVVMCLCMIFVTYRRNRTPDTEAHPTILSLTLVQLTDQAPEMTAVTQGSEGQLVLTVRAEEYRTLGKFGTS